MTTQIHGGSTQEDRAVVLLPVQLVHVIDQDSPLYTMDPAQLNTSDIEIVVVMEAVVEPSGNTTQEQYQ